jgi:hypothetical protein
MALERIHIRNLKPGHKLVNLGLVTQVDEYSNGWLVCLEADMPDVFYKGSTHYLTIETD